VPALNTNAERALVEGDGGGKRSGSRGDVGESGIRAGVGVEAHPNTAPVTSRTANREGAAIGDTSIEDWEKTNPEIRLHRNSGKVETTPGQLIMNYTDEGGMQQPPVPCTEGCWF
jgi:hypothetical protein